MRPEDLQDGWYCLAPTVPKDRQSSGHVQSRTLIVSCGLGTKIVEVPLPVVRKNPAQVVHLPSFCDAISASVSMGFIPSGIESGTGRYPCRLREPQCRPSGKRVEVVVAIASHAFALISQEKSSESGQVGCEIQQVRSWPVAQFWSWRAIVVHRRQRPRPDGVGGDSTGRVVRVELLGLWSWFNLGNCQQVVKS